MDQVTQQNAALVEEAAAAESLQDQAKNVWRRQSVCSVSVAMATWQRRKSVVRNVAQSSRQRSRTSRCRHRQIIIAIAPERKAPAAPEAGSQHQ
jgi:hypothetical protein